MNSILYQVANGNIYSINTTTGVQTNIASLGYDATVDILVYGTNIAIITSAGQQLKVFNGSTVTTPKTVGNTVVTYTTLINSFSVGDLLVGMTSAAYWYVVALDTGAKTITFGTVTGTFSVAENIANTTAPSTHVVDGVVSAVYTPAVTDAIIEYCRSYSFLGGTNVLYISQPITALNPENSYNFFGRTSQNITYDSNIAGLKWTMNWLYVFTESKVEYLGANSLQNVAGAAAFISTPLGQWAAPINNLCIAADGDTIYYISKNLHVQKISYMNGTNATEMWELSARPVIGIRELLNTVSTVQPTAYAEYNENDKTIQFHVRTVWSGFNNIAIIYDIINDTWNVDTGKNYNYIVKAWAIYYGFSDVNTSIYTDDVGFSDAGVPIDFKIISNNFNQHSPMQKMYGGFYATWGIGALTTIDYAASIDQEDVFADSVVGDASGLPNAWEIGGSAIGDEPIGWELIYTTSLVPFDRIADVGRMYKAGKRIQITISSASQIQDFILDGLGIFFEPTTFSDISDKF